MSKCIVYRVSMSNNIYIVKLITTEKIVWKVSMNFIRFDFVFQQLLKNVLILSLRV